VTLDGDDVVFQFEMYRALLCIVRRYIKGTTKKKEEKKKRKKKEGAIITTPTAIDLSHPT
jgi:hypothetical protein